MGVASVSRRRTMDTNPAGRIASMTRDEVWDRCSRLLQDMYRADARHLLAVIEPYRRSRDGGT